MGHPPVGVECKVGRESKNAEPSFTRSYTARDPCATYDSRNTSSEGRASCQYTSEKFNGIILLLHLRRSINARGIANAGAGPKHYG